MCNRFSSLLLNQTAASRCELRKRRKMKITARLKSSRLGDQAPAVMAER